MATEYRLESVADFLAVPEDKLAECFADFATWLRLARTAAAVEKIFGHGVEFSTDGFVWRDDGISGLSALDLITGSGEHIATVELGDQFAAAGKERT